AHDGVLVVVLVGVPDRPVRRVSRGHASVRDRYVVTGGQDRIAIELTLKIRSRSSLLRSLGNRSLVGVGGSRKREQIGRHDLRQDAATEHQQNPGHRCKLSFHGTYPFWPWRELFPQCRLGMLRLRGAVNCRRITPLNGCFGTALP